MFTPDEYYNIVEFRPTGAGTRRDEVVEEIQQQRLTSKQLHVSYSWQTM